MKTLYNEIKSNDKNEIDLRDGLSVEFMPKSNELFVVFPIPTNFSTFSTLYSLLFTLFFRNDGKNVPLILFLVIEDKIDEERTQDNGCIWKWTRRGQSDWKAAEKRDENINSVTFFWIEFHRSFGFWNNFNSFFYSQHEICVLSTD